MDRHQALILNVWREAGRQTDMATSIGNIAQWLKHALPLERMLVRRLEPERGCVETVGRWPDTPRSRPAPARSDCPAAAMRRLLAWCRRRAVAHWQSGSRNERDLALVVPSEMEGEVLAGPLLSDHGACGVVLLLATPPQRFMLPHQKLFQELLEPLAAVLENDRRLHELTTLREAAEADKQSLLRRLGRAEVADTIIGATGRLRPVMERVDLVSRSDVPVLILGETGSGKEVIARAIHSRSTRAAGPFIRVNCGAIPPDLIDSELFGHERGSFTGATGTRRGWFERADEGTLFLDEIGELSLAAQVRLLRVLQEGVFERVGGERAVKVDVRIVTATHRDLPVLVQHGKFREDLWYRIAIFPIVLPPLREHPADIAALAEHFAHRAAVRFGLPLQLPSPDDMALLTDYAWPGNVRELTAVIDRAAILGQGAGLEVAKALGVTPGMGVGLAVADRPNTLQTPPEAAPVALDEVIKQHIEATLTTTRGRIEGPYGAASLLRVNPHTLRGKMRKLGIEWKKFRSA